MSATGDSYWSFIPGWSCRARSYCRMGYLAAKIHKYTVNAVFFLVYFILWNFQFLVFFCIRVVVNGFMIVLYESTSTCIHKHVLIVVTLLDGYEVEVLNEH